MGTSALSGPRSVPLLSVTVGQRRVAGDKTGAERSSGAGLTINIEIPDRALISLAGLRMIPANTQIWLVAGVTDMRRGFSSLSSLCRARSTRARCRDKFLPVEAAEVRVTIDKSSLSFWLITQI